VAANPLRTPRGVCGGSAKTILAAEEHLPANSPP